MIENRRHQIFSIAGSVLVHLILMGAIFSTGLGRITGGPGTINVFMADGKDSLMIADPGGPQGGTMNHGSEKQSRSAIPGRDLKADQKRESKSVRSDQHNPPQVPAPSVIKATIMAGAPVRHEEETEVQDHGDKEARPRDAAVDSLVSKGSGQDIAGFEKADLEGHVSLGALYSGAFGGNNGPRFHEQVMPVYPDSAIRRGKEYQVVLKLMIDETGRLTHMEVIETAGFGFDQAAAKAIRESTFVPARVNGNNVKSEALLTVRFVLQ